MITSMYTQKEIIESMYSLKEKISEIEKKGYIKGISKGYSSIGRTLENELGLVENEFGIPDYNGIEIKTRRTYSKSAITLFNATPDGDELFEIERIKNTYGYPCKKDRRFKVLYIEAYGNKLNYAGIKYQYKIQIDREKEKIYLCVYDRNDNIIERKVSWSFKYIKERLILKINYLALINAWNKKIGNNDYFKYYKITFYELISFDKFIDLIENGTIKMVIKVDIHTGKNNYGKTYDHGCGFSIKEENLTKLFKKIII